MFIDTHCHLNFDSFDDDRDAMIERALAAGVEHMIVPATDLRNCPDVIKLAEQYDSVYCAVGVHPNSTADWRPSHIDEIRAFSAHERVVAIGEIGLDYYWDKSPHEAQQTAFREQMELADELELPVIVHNRDSSNDVIELIAASPLVGKPNSGVLHSFSATATVAQQALDLGFYLGFTGPLTFKKADALRAIAATVPLNRILLETDAPFLAPHPKRGKRNEPALVPLIADRMAALHGMSVAEIGRITTANAQRLFAIK